MSVKTFTTRETLKFAGVAYGVGILGGIIIAAVVLNLNA